MQVMVLLNATSLETVAQVFLPRCSPSSTAPAAQTALCGTEQKDYRKAVAQGQAGWNNWSGGYCPASARSPDDRRFITLDGFQLLL